MSKIFVTGATGFMGKPLVAALVQRGDQVVALSRKAATARERLGSSPSVEIVEGDPQYAGSWQARVSGCTAVVHLAGEPVGTHRWNTRVRQILRDSRVDGTRRLVEAIGAAPADARPRALVSASGIDYYPLDVDVRGMDDDDQVDESTGPGDHFLARVCADWEAEAREAEGLGLRVVLMRTGLVVGGSGGAMDKWAAAFRRHVGGRLGNGRQWVTWIHLDDALAAYLFALDHAALAGPVNLVAPGRLRNAEFARQLGESMGKPSWLPVPGPALRLAVGGMAEYLLAGRPAVPGALLRAGFTFRHQRPFGDVPPSG
ncbi:MAG TPA: TIGR01777 family oxidoreductase [Kofleriaceae bacterium]|nr:TIGR01777 family oxidoreductase [Kofleriaceae bacterium]